jgi:hypothetical protein
MKTAAGDIYVTDASSHTVQRFSNTWTPLGQWGTPGTALGQFDIPRGIAGQLNYI